MLAAMLPALAAGQTVRGRLLESGSGDPIVLGTVALLDTTMALIEETFTNEDGNFILEAPRPGSYLVLADRLGYQRKVDGIIDLGEGGRISIDFYLKPQPIVLDSLTVEADRRRIERRLADAGFYDRQQAGFGWFIGPDEIDRRPIMTTRDLLRTAPRLWIVEGFPGESIVMRTNRGEPCTPQLYVDGGRIATVSSGTGVQLDEVVNVEEITGVEVYDGGADTPLLYGGTQNGCGVLIVWTKGGR